MKHRQRNRLIALLLSLTLLLGMLPAASLAAEDDLTATSSIMLQRAFTHETISVNCSSDEIGLFQNYYQSFVTQDSLTDNPLEWLLLSFVLEKGQNVSLELWRLPESESDSNENPVEMAPSMEGPDVNEDFLGEQNEPIGYLSGIRIMNNILVEEDENGDPVYSLIELTDEELSLACMEAIKEGAEPTTMYDEEFVGHKGEPYIPVSTLSMLSAASDETFFTAAPNIVMWGDSIVNYVLWDGTVVDEEGHEIDVDYTNGKYVISMTPTLEENKIYNQFVGFVVNMDSCSYDMAPDLFDWFYDNLSNGIKLNAILEYAVKSRDPIDLLTGSFLWDYTDTALYGSHDLSFNRYYSSFHAGSNEGLGYGWSSDYTARLEFSGPTIKAVLPGGTSRTFVRAADGTLQASAGSIYTLESVSGGYLLERQDGVRYQFD